MRRPKLAPEVRDISTKFYDAVSKLEFLAKDPKASVEIFFLATEQLLARQRIQTYVDLISLLRSHRGVAHGIDHLERVLATMIKNEKELYRLEDVDEPTNVQPAGPRCRNCEEPL